MTTVDEKEILEIEKLKADYRKVIQDLDKDMFYLKLDVFKVGLLTIAVTTAVVTAYFKFKVGL